MTKVLPTLKNALVAIVKGEFLKRLRVQNYFLHIVFVLVLIAVSIWINLLTDSTMTKVERGNRRLEDQKTEIAMRVFEIQRLSGRGEVESRLKELGSDVGESSTLARQIE